MIRQQPISTRTYTLFPYTTLFRSIGEALALQQRDTLEIAAIVAGRLQPQRLKLAGHIARSNFVTAGGGFAPFQQIVGEKRDVCGNALCRRGVGVGLLRLGAGAGGEQRSEEHTSELRSQMRN